MVWSGKLQVTQAGYLELEGRQNKVGVSFPLADSINIWMLHPKQKDNSKGYVIQYHSINIFVQVHGDKAGFLNVTQNVWWS